MSENTDRAIEDAISDMVSSKRDETSKEKDRMTQYFASHARKIKGNFISNTTTTDNNSNSNNNNNCNNNKNCNNNYYKALLEDTMNSRVLRQPCGGPRVDSRREGVCEMSRLERQIVVMSLKNMQQDEQLGIIF